MLPVTGVSVRGMEYDMRDFLSSCVARYQELTGVKVMRKASTPFLAEPTKPDFSGADGVWGPEPDPVAALAELQSDLNRGDHTQRCVAAAWALDGVSDPSQAQ